MTTVRLCSRSARLWQVDGKLLRAVLVGLVCASQAVAQQDRPAHWLHAGAMPPGAIGRQRLLRGGPLSPYTSAACYMQPTEIRVPEGVGVAAASGNGFSQAHRQRLLVGLQVASVYRFLITDIPNYPGVEVFPTVELVDRLHPPPGMHLKFPVPIDITYNELLMAAGGKYVTRVIYVEDPMRAAAVAYDAKAKNPWIEVRAGDDPLVTAKVFGRPIAILRMGGRVPSDTPAGALPYSGAEPLIYDLPENDHRAEALPQGPLRFDSPKE